MIGKPGDIHNLLQHAKDKSIELDALDAAASAVAIERFHLLSSLISSPRVSKDVKVFFNIYNTPEGLAAAQDLLSGFSRSAMATPSTEESPKADSHAPIQLMPTAGGMALGLVGGIGLGMALEVLRSAASASGNPVLGGLAIGFGLLGTAIGGGIGSGLLNEFEIAGIGKVSAAE
jgi:hypothetical protein